MWQYNRLKRTGWLNNIQAELLLVDLGPLFRRSAIPNLAAVCASTYHTIHALALTLTLILVRIVDLRNSGPVPDGYRRKK